MSGAKGNDAPGRGAGSNGAPPSAPAPALFQASVAPAAPRGLSRLARGVLAAAVLIAAASALAGLRVLVKTTPPTAASSAPRPFTPPTPVSVADGAMVLVPGGTFRMGSNEGDPDEKPITEVRVPTFEIDVTEVTVAAFERCVSAGKCTAPDTGMYCNWHKEGRDRHPVNCVDLTQATAYCAFVTKRLPTEEEWEYAATGGDGRTYPWNGGTAPHPIPGDDGGSARRSAELRPQTPGAQLCWNGEGSDVGKGQRESTCPVASYPSGRAPCGAFDMAGNVWEWTASAHCPYDQRGCVATPRVIRGGAWNNVLPQYVRAQDRAVEQAGSRPDNVGFRCVKSPS